MTKVIKRNGQEADFDSYKITIAILSALNETKEGNYEIAQFISEKVKEKINGETSNVEQIQDLVEQTLMTEGYFKTAKAYILYREEHKQQREFETGLMKSIAKLSKETSRDNANIGHSPASKMYQIGSTASKSYYLNKLLPKNIAKLYNDGDIHIHDFDYYDKTFNCLSIPLERMLKNMLDYEFEYGSVRNPRRIGTVMPLASIILQRISNDIFGGTLLPNIDITIQNLINEDYIEKPTDEEIEQSIQSLLYNLATMATRAGNQIPFSSITFGLETGEYGRKVTEAVLVEFEKGMGKGETFIFPNLVFKCLSGVSFQETDKNYDLYKLAVKVSCRRMNPTFNFLDCNYYKDYDPKEVNVMGNCQKDEIVVYKINGQLYTESFWRMYERIEGQEKQFGISAYKELKNVEILDSGKFIKCNKIMKTKPYLPLLRITTKNGRVITVTEDHPLPVQNKGKVKSHELQIGDKLKTEFQSSSFEPSFNKPLPNNWAYVLGLLITDGNYDNGISITLGKDETDIGQRFINYTKELGWNIHVHSYERGKKGYYDAYNLNGFKDGERINLIETLTTLFGGRLKSERHIPNALFDNTRSAKLNFLAGMIDGDGHINKAKSRVQIGSTNKELALQTIYLTQSLGMTAKVYLNRYNSQDTNKLRYRIEFYPTKELVNLLASQKKKDSFSHTGEMETSNYCAITKIENLGVLNENVYDVETETGYFSVSNINSSNCRTHVIANINGDNISEGRGNIFPTTINLPRISLKTKGINFNKDIKDFYRKLEKMLDNVKELSLQRYGILGNLSTYDVPYVMGEGVYYKSNELQEGDKIENSLKQGTIAIGYIGIAECVKELIGVHHGESERALELALEINKFIKDICDKYTQETGLNWSCYATPAESTCGKVIKDRKDYGEIEGVTDKDYYTNSFHVPVYYPISIARKLTIEGLFHPYNNGGRISYIELTAPPVHNIEGVIEVHKHMYKSNIGYAGINFPIDECKGCSHSGIIGDICSICGSTEIKKIRRVSGYLGFSERINDSKGQEIKDRFKHDSVN